MMMLLLWSPSMPSWAGNLLAFLFGDPLARMNIGGGEGLKERRPFLVNSTAERVECIKDSEFTVLLVGALFLVALVVLL